MKYIRNTATLLAFAFMVACAVAPQTFNDKAAVAYGAVTAIRNTTATLLTANKINADDAQNIQKQADNLRAAIDIARTVAATDQTGATAKLDATLAALNALTTYLANQGK